MIRFAWDEKKNAANLQKHGIDFEACKIAFADTQRLIVEDAAHSQREQRFFCIGRVSEGIVTVRFTWRDGVIRIIGAGFWREGKARYEKENAL